MTIAKVPKSNELPAWCREVREVEYRGRDGNTYTATVVAGQIPGTRYSDWTCRVRRTDGAALTPEAAEAEIVHVMQADHAEDSAAFQAALEDAENNEAFGRDSGW